MGFFLSEIVSELQLESDSLEPCLFTGRLKSGAVCMLLSYVDDILIASETEKDIEEVLSVIGKKVVLKKTGLVQSSKGGGGQLKFLGRQIFRQKGDKAIFAGLPEDYLKATFESFGLKTGSGSAPDITSLLDQEGKELTPEAYNYSRFRSALGKLSWFAQTRQDIRAWVGLLATQQAKPTENTEKALRAVLRFLVQDQGVVLRLPAETPPRETTSHPLADSVEDKLVAFSDASHAPLKSTGRRGVTGGVITFCDCLIKTLSRHQQLVSLSSMESELYALQAVAQEMVSVGKFVGRVMRTIGRGSKDSMSGVLYSDSESSLKLLRNLDVPRKSCHLEIKLEWIKESQVNRGSLVLSFLKGTNNPSDLLTKCLGTSAFEYHRSCLGFEVIEGSLSSLTRNQRNMVFVEVCCERGSALACEAKRLGIPYMGITQDMESKSTQTAVSQHLNQYRDPKKVFVHVSSPCASGSPLRHFKGNDEPTSADFDWDQIFPHVGFYLKLGDCSSFELPWRNEIWNRYLTKETLNKRTLISMCKSTYVQLVFEQLLEKRLVRVWGSPPTLVRL